jgi:RNA polymerase sigma factor (sigma-70 family)
VNQAQPIAFVVDDDEAVRDSLRLLLKAAGVTSRCYDSAEAFLTDFRPDEYGCLVLDIRMPGMSGLELQEVLHERNVALPIVFITAHGDVPMAVEAVRRGAVDFIQKPFDDEILVEKVADALSSSERQHEEKLERNEIRRRVDSLTAREHQVMTQVVQGKANKVIASDLGVSQRTVEIHRSRVMEKMQAASLAQLVRMVLIAESDI